MDAIVVGLLTGGAAVVAVLLWQLLVRPEATLAWWAGRAPDDRWLDPATVRALRMAGGGMVFLLGFLVGLALTFLQATAGG